MKFRVFGMFAGKGFDPSSHYIDGMGDERAMVSRKILKMLHIITVFGDAMTAVYGTPHGFHTKE